MILDREEAQAWLREQPEYDALAESRMTRFVQLLGRENERQNLVSAESLSAVWTRHIVDSAQLLRLVPRETIRWLDLGTGAGFPGIVVAILWPHCQVTLVESRTLRAHWLDTAAIELGLTNTQVIASRVEVIKCAATHAISARAFAPLDRLVPLAARFSTSETTWVLPKGRSARDELTALRGWRHSFHVEQSLTDDDAGIITGRLAGRA